MYVEMNNSGRLNIMNLSTGISSLLIRAIDGLSEDPSLDENSLHRLFVLSAEIQKTLSDQEKELSADLSQSDQKEPISITMFKL